MAKLSLLNFFLSGGGANLQPNQSLGGYRSTTKIISETVDDNTPLSGVTINYASDNGTGTGTLFFDFSENTLAWSAPGEILGAPVDVSITGSYTLFSDASGYIHVSVDSANLPFADASAPLSISQTMNNLFDDIEKAESIAGDTEYRCFYIRNEDTETFYDAKIYIKSQPTGADSLALGIDPQGVHNVTETTATLANESTAPGSVTFTSPTQGSPLSIGDIGSGYQVAIWIRRTVPANTLTSTPNDYSTIGLEVSF